MRDDVGVADVDGAIGEEGAEEGADDAVRLVGAAHVAVADVEEHHRLHPRRGRGGGRRGRREEESGGGRHGLDGERANRRRLASAAAGGGGATEREGGISSPLGVTLG